MKGKGKKKKGKWREMGENYKWNIFSEKERDRETNFFIFLFFLEDDEKIDTNDLFNYLQRQLLGGDRNFSHKFNTKYRETFKEQGKGKEMNENYKQQNVFSERERNEFFYFFRRRWKDWWMIYLQR